MSKNNDELVAVPSSNQGFTKSEKHKFTKIGESLTGKYIEKAVMKDKKGKPFNKYVLETSSGNKGFLGNWSLDSQFDNILIGANPVEVTFTEEVENKNGGAPMKIFLVRTPTRFHVTPTAEAVEKARNQV